VIRNLTKSYQFFQLIGPIITPKFQWNRCITCSITLNTEWHTDSLRQTERSYKLDLVGTDLCPCGETQTMSHIVESCPLTKLNGGLSRLHSADEDAVSWLSNYGLWNAYEKKLAEVIIIIYTKLLKWSLVHRACQQHCTHSKVVKLLLLSGIICCVWACERWVVMCCRLLCGHHVVVTGAQRRCVSAVSSKTSTSTSLTDSELTLTDSCAQVSLSLSVVFLWHVTLNADSVTATRIYKVKVNMTWGQW